MQHFVRILKSGLLALSIACLPLLGCAMKQGTRGAATADRASIIALGAIGDGETVNTLAIQAAIDRFATNGGGTVVIPQGVFVTGAIFLKPGVNLYFEDGAVLKGSTDKKDYPKRRTRIEGHFEEWLPALINADHVDHLRISGAGTLDGNGAPFWEEFWAARRQDPKVTNVAVERPRLMFLQDCAGVQISGLRFKDSGFWNLHLYRCRDVVVENSRFEVPAGVKCPSTDGTDIDSCQNVTIRDCYYRVNDDCVCLKGSKGPFAMDDKDSPPVEHIRVSNCTFERGNGVVTLGSEATVIRDVVVENCKVVGQVCLAKFKFRPDTPQHYEDVHFRGINLDFNAGPIIDGQPWKQFFDLKGQPPPKSIVRDITLSHITGRFGTIGTLQGNPGQTTISDVALQNIDVQLEEPRFHAVQVKNLRLQNVKVNGKPFAVKGEE